MHVIIFISFFSLYCNNTAPRAKSLASVYRKNVLFKEGCFKVADSMNSSFVLRKESFSSIPHFRGVFFRMSLYNGSCITLNFSEYFEQKFVNPKNACNCFLFFGGGKYSILSTFLGSIRSLSQVRIYPRYFTSSLRNQHFLKFKVILKILHRSKVSSKCFKCSSNVFEMH